MGELGGLYDFECIYESRELVIEVWITFVDKKQTWSYQYIHKYIASAYNVQIYVRIID